MTLCYRIWMHLEAAGGATVAEIMVAAGEPRKRVHDAIRAMRRTGRIVSEYRNKQRKIVHYLAHGIAPDVEGRGKAPGSAKGRAIGSQRWREGLQKMLAKRSKMPTFVKRIPHPGCELERHWGRMSGLSRIDGDGDACENRRGEVRPENSEAA